MNNNLWKSLTEILIQVLLYFLHENIFFLYLWKTVEKIDANKINKHQIQESCNQVTVMG